MVSSLQHVTGSAVAVLGTTSGTSTLDFAICYMPFGGTTLSSLMVPLTATVTTTRTPFAVSSSTSGLIAGSYVFGMCAHNNSSNSVNNNDWVNGWVIVTN